MQTFNNETLRRFGIRLEEQANNFKLATDRIDENFREICDILKKYQFSAIGAFQSAVPRVNYSLATQANQYGELWYSTFRNTSEDIVLLAAAMLEFYDFSTSLGNNTQEKLAKVKEMFVSYYNGDGSSYNRNTDNIYWDKWGYSGDYYNTDPKSIYKS